MRCSVTVKPCSVEKSRIWALVLFKTRRREMGLYETGSVRPLLGFRMGMVFAAFQIMDIVSFIIERLLM